MAGVSVSGHTKFTKIPVKTFSVSDIVYDIVCYYPHRGKIESRVCYVQERGEALKLQARSK